MNLYYDTILKLYERGYLFEDDPELDEIRVLLAQGGAQSSTDAAGAVSILFSRTAIYPNVSPHVIELFSPIFVVCWRRRKQRW